MNYTYLLVFIENYSLPTLIVSGLVTVLTLLYDRFFASKLPTCVRNFLPFILSIVFYYAFDMLFILRDFVFSPGTFSAGILSGSLSIIIKASIYRLKDGKSINFNAQTLIIENLLSGLIKRDLMHLVINEIISIIESDSMDKEQEIIKTLANNSEEKMDDNEFKVLAPLLIKAVSVVK